MSLHWPCHRFTRIAAGIYRINTPVEMRDGSGFNFNQYLVGDEAPLLFHSGPRRMSRWCARRSPG